MKKIQKKNLFIIIWVAFILFAGRNVREGAHYVFNRDHSAALKQVAESKNLQFEAGLVGQLPLVLQMAQVPVTVKYMEDPTNEEIRKIAMQEFETFQNSFISKSSFWVGEKEMIFYSDLKPAYTVDPDLPENYWYYLTVNDKTKDYNFNINYNDDLKSTCLWVNACVRDKSGRGIGMVGTGIPLDGFINTMYKNIDDKISMYLFNSQMEVTGAKDITIVNDKKNILDVLPELKDKDLKQSDSFAIKTKKGVYYLYSIPTVDWTIVLHEKYTLKDMANSMGFPLSVVIFVALAIGILQFISLVGNPLKLLRISMKDISSGNADLTKRIDMTGMTTIKIMEEICTGFNVFIEKLDSIVENLVSSKNQLVEVGSILQDSTKDTTSSISQIIGNIDSMSIQVGSQTQSVEETASAVNQIAANIESLNRMIESQTTAVTQASAAVEQMIGNINSVSSSVEKMSTSFKDLEEKAIVGVRKQNDVNVLIKEIETESQSLQVANAVISRIAQQTNLLAMNAAIEAAHAGETGKGFSVVADEIRKLSVNSSNQSQTIGTQLEKIIESISNVVSASHEASESFNIVADGINETSNLVQEMTNAMNEQNEGTKQIVDALTSMNDTSSQVNNSSYEMAKGNKAILDEVKRLQDATSSIKDEMEKISVDARKIDETGSALSSLSTKMEESIELLESQVDQFTV